MNLRQALEHEPLRILRFRAPAGLTEEELEALPSRALVVGVSQGGVTWSQWVEPGHRLVILDRDSGEVAVESSRRDCYYRCHLVAFVGLRELGTSHYDLTDVEYSGPEWN